MSNYTLCKTIDAKRALAEHPELFDLKSLSIEDKSDILNTDTKFYIDKLDLENASAYEKFYLITHSNKSSVFKKFKLSTDEVSKLSKSQLNFLLVADFRTYINVDTYNNLTRSDKSSLFLKRYDWILENIGHPPDMLSDDLSALTRKPEIIEKYFTDFSTLTTNYIFWSRMISYNKEKWIDIFLHNTHSMLNKSEVRSVISYYPDIIKKLTVDIISDSKLSSKEWALLINRVMNNKSKFFKDFKLSDEIIEFFELDLSVSVLMGKSSKQLKSATKNIMVANQESTEDNVPRTS